MSGIFPPPNYIKSPTEHNRALLDSAIRALDQYRERNKEDNDYVEVLIEAIQRLKASR